MLTKQENKVNFHCLAVFSTLCLLPITVDQRNGCFKVHRQTNRIRLIIWHLNFLFGLIHWLYMAARMYQSLKYPELFRIDHFIIHFLMVSGFTVLDVWSYVQFIANPTNNSLIFNKLFEDEEQSKLDVENGGDKEESKPVAPPRRLFSLKFEYSFHELMALSLPLATVFGFGFILLFFVWDSSRIQLFYSSLPDRHQTVGSFLACFVLEVLAFSGRGATAIFTLVTLVLFLEKCEWEFEVLFERMSTISPRQFLTEFRELYLLIHLSNRTFPWIIFPFKLFCMTQAVFLCYFTIAHYEEKYFLCAFTGYVSCNIIFFYGIVFQRAFRIPENMERAKRDALMLVKHGHGKNEISFPEFKRSLEAIEDLGVQVGSFNTLERQSTLDFLDFIVNNVVSLLITFP